MDITGSEEEENSMPTSTSLAALSDSSRLRMLTTSALAAAAEEDEDEEEEEEEDKQQRKEKKVRYRECQKNHAANLGGHVTDGCGEFMPGGAEGTPEALRCAACECHRNFHRREVEGEHDCDCFLRRPPSAAAVTGPNLLTLPFAGGGALTRPRMMVGVGGAAAFHKAPGGCVAVEDEREGRFLSNMAEGHGHGSVRKRFRTKFTHEQKERMLAFAQRLGWRIQKQDEVAVQNFCQEVGVKRHVLKVWMHNNKHNFASKSQEDNITAPVAAANNNNSTSTTTTTTTTTNTKTSHNGINNLFN